MIIIQPTAGQLLFLENRLEDLKLLHHSGEFRMGDVMVLEEELPEKGCSNGNDVPGYRIMEESQSVGFDKADEICGYDVLNMRF